MSEKLPRVPDSLVEQEIIDRADRAATHRQNDIWMTTIVVTTVLIAMTQPIHAWLHAHLEFLAGIVAGASPVAIAWGVYRWRRGDRPK